MINCCHNCKKRTVNASYNCHDHCEIYLKQRKGQTELNEKIKSAKDAVRMVNSVKDEKVRRAMKHKNT